MRLAIISDVHGNLLALEAVLDDIEARGVDAIVNLGDCVTSPLWPAETLALLDAIDMPTVRGNHDRLLLETPLDEMPRSMRYTFESLSTAQRTALHELPVTIELEGGILLMHGRMDDDKKYLMHDKEDGRIAVARAGTLAQRLEGVTASLVLCGHSHTPQVALSAGRVVVNPGSVGEPRNADDDDLERSEASSPHARYAIAEQRGGTWRVDLLAVEYDWAAVAARATENGRADFARAFT